MGGFQLGRNHLFPVIPVQIQHKLLGNWRTVIKRRGMAEDRTGRGDLPCGNTRLATLNVLLPSCAEAHQSNKPAAFIMVSTQGRNGKSGRCHLFVFMHHLKGLAGFAEELTLLMVLTFCGLGIRAVASLYLGGGGLKQLKLGYFILFWCQRFAGFRTIVYSKKSLGIYESSSEKQGIVPQKHLWLTPLTLVPQCLFASDRMGTFVCLGHCIKNQDMIKSS